MEIMIHGSMQVVPTKEKRLEIIKEHLNLMIEVKGEYVGIREMRKYIYGYVKNLKDSAKLRQIVNSLETKTEVVKCLDEYFASI